MNPNLKNHQNLQQEETVERLMQQVQLPNEYNAEDSKTCYGGDKKPPSL
jgi:hypothetical protein